LDDFLVLFVAAKLLQRIIPPDVLAECRQLADAAEMRRKQEVRSTAGVVGFIAIAAVWLLVAAGVSILMARYLSPTRPWQNCPRKRCDAALVDGGPNVLPRVNG
jgi:hypothetical protein